MLTSHWSNHYYFMNFSYVQQTKLISLSVMGFPFFFSIFQNIKNLKKLDPISYLKPSVLLIIGVNLLCQNVYAQIKNVLKKKTQLIVKHGLNDLMY